MRRAGRYAVFGAFAVGCIVSGVEIDPALGDDEDEISGSGGGAGHGPTGGANQGGVGRGGEGTGGSGRGGTGPGGTDAGGTDAGGTDAGGTGPGGSDAGGTDSGGTDMGGMDTGGSDTGGANAGGSGTQGGTGGALAGSAGMGGTGGGGMSGAGSGGTASGGAGAAGTAGMGGSAGSSGGGTGGASCKSIVPGMPCSEDGATCVDEPCGLGDVGRWTCSCPEAGSDWNCSACGYAGTLFETQPVISSCYPDTTDGVECGNSSQVCGPNPNEYCYCRDEADSTWDCDQPPAHWGCTGVHVTMTLTGGTTTHDHLPLTEAEQAALTTHIRSAFATADITLPTEMGHTHTFTLLPVQVTALRNGGAATDIPTTTVDQHFHIYSLRCAP